MQLYGRVLVRDAEGEGVDYRNEQMEAEALGDFLGEDYPDQVTQVKLESGLNSSIGGPKLTTSYNSYHYVACNFAGLWSQCGLVVFENWRGMGDVLGEMEDFHFKRLETIAVKCLGYTSAMVTLVDPAKIAMAERQGYQKIDNFLNVRSGNRVYLLTKKLQ